jgi:hypothetical protein
MEEEPMRNFTYALLAGGLLSGIAGGAFAQDVASAVPAPKSEYMVFTQKANHELSPTATATLQAVAHKARGAGQITLTGSKANVAEVKAALMREGVSADSIVARNEAAPQLPKAGDGLSDPAERGVAITF